MRLWLISLGLLGALAAVPALAQSSIERPDPVEQPAAAEDTAPAATARKPASAKPAAKPAVTPAAAPAKPDPKQNAKTSTAKVEPAKIEPAKIEPAKTEPAKAETKTETKSAPAATDLSPADRLVIQNALSWAGDFGAPVEGEDPLTTAIKNFQKRSNSKITGTLTPEERERLLAAGRSREAEYGWRVVDDAATGARIGLPMKMIPVRQETRDGTRWRSRHGDVQVETFRLNNGLSLAALFELEKKQPITRKVEYNVMRGDSFYIAGLQGLRKFAVRAFSRNGEIRGFLVQFDQALEGIVEPVATAMASTYSAFPANGVTLASATTATRKVEYGSAVVVSTAGHLVTDRRLTDGCQVLIAAGYGPAEAIAGDLNFTLLRIYGARNLVAAPLAEVATGDVTLRGVPEPRAQEGDGNVKDAAARIAATQISPSPGAGYSGAGAFDAAGKLAGLVSVRSTVVASTDAVAPQATLLPADALRAFLAVQQIAPASAASGKPTVMRLICVR